MSDPFPGRKAQRNQAHAQLREVGWTGQELIARIARELAGTGAIRIRTAWRVAHDLSLDEVATRFNAVSDDARATMSKSRLWDFEQWPKKGPKGKPGFKVLQLLAEVYQCEWTDLLDCTDLAAMSADDRAEYRRLLQEATASTDSQEASSSDVAPSTVLAQYVHPVIRPRGSPEMLAVASLPASFGMSLPVLTQSSLFSLSLVSRLDTGGYGVELMNDLRRELDGIADTYMVSSPFPLYWRAISIRDQLVALIGQGGRPTQMSELYRLTARCCAWLGWISSDIGAYAAGRDHTRAAWACAEQADDDAARRWVRVAQSRLAFWCGDFVESARLAADGSRYASGEDMDAFLALLESRAWAGAGDVRGATQALKRWESIRGNPIPMGSSERFFHPTRDRQHYMAGTSLLGQGKSSEAISQLAYSLQVYDRMPAEERFYGTEMLIRVDIACGHLRSRELEGAVNILEPVLSLAPSHRLDMVMRALGTVRGDLEAQDFAGGGLARATVARIGDFCREAKKFQEENSHGQ